MPRDENRPRPFRATFSFHLPAAKSCWLRAARLHRRRLHFRRASGSRALESFDYPVSSSVPLRSTSWTYVCLVCVLICVYIYMYTYCTYVYVCTYTLVDEKGRNVREAGGIAGRRGSASSALFLELLLFIDDLLCSPI